MASSEGRALRWAQRTLGRVLLGTLWRLRVSCAHPQRGCSWNGELGIVATVLIYRC